jgi:hypothetical protein
MIASSHEVLAVHHLGPSSHEEIVLWERDASNQGVIDPDELCIISHSELLRLVRVYRLDPRSADVSTPALARRKGPVGGIPVVNSSTVRTPGFCGRWRAAPSVTARVLQSGISDMRILVSAQPSSSAPANQAELTLRLKWATDSADGDEEATTLVRAKLRPDDRRSFTQQE